MRRKIWMDFPALAPQPHSTGRIAIAGATEPVELGNGHDVHLHERPGAGRRRPAPGIDVRKPTCDYEGRVETLIGVNPGCVLMEFFA